jgi:hypothetical protein
LTIPKKCVNLGIVLTLFGDKIVYITCKFKHCLSYGSFEIEDSKIAWFKKKGFDIPTTCQPCKSWRDSISRDEQIRCSNCYSNPREYTTKQIIGAQMLGDRSWDEVRESYVCKDCYHEAKRASEPKHQIKCSYVHCLSDRGIFEIGQGQIDSFNKKGLTLPNSCQPCRDWKNSVQDERVDCKTCKTSSQFPAHRIISQNKKGDESWSSFKRSFKCNNCKRSEGALTCTCTNNYCHSEQLTGKKQFTLNKGELDFFKTKNLSIPSTCKVCRDYKKGLKDQLCKCTVCNRDKMVTALTLLHKSNELRVSVEGYKEKFECSECVEQGVNAWYPRGNSWAQKDGYKYRWKMDVNNNVTDQLYADPTFTDQEAHDMHIHVWNMDSGRDSGVGSSFRQGFISPSLLYILQRAGLKLDNNFQTLNGKIKLTSNNPNDRFDIGFEVFQDIINWWKYNN